METSPIDPLTCGLPAIVLVGGLLYFVYGALDRFGLGTQHADARVTTKQFAKGSTSYNTNVIEDRARLARRTTAMYTWLDWT